MINFVRLAPIGCSVLKNLGHPITGNTLGLQTGLYLGCVIDGRYPGVIDRDTCRQFKRGSLYNHAHMGCYRQGYIWDQKQGYVWDLEPTGAEG